MARYQDYSVPIHGERIDTRDLVKRKAWLEKTKNEATQAEEYAESIKDDPDKKQSVLDAMEPLNDDEQEELDDIEKIENGVNDFSDGEMLIDEDNFQDFAKEYAEEMGKNLDEWPYDCIDWSEAANALKSDYTEYRYNGCTYLARDRD